MDKKEFLDCAAAALSKLPPEAAQQKLSELSGRIDSLISDGISEEEAVSSLGTPKGAAEAIAAELSQSDSPYTERGNAPDTVRSRRPITTVLLILGAPLWLCLLLAAAAVLLALFIVIWTAVIAIHAVSFACAIACIAGPLSAFFYFESMNVPGALFMIGAGVFFAGASVLVLLLASAAGGGARKLSGKTWRGIRSLFRRKEVSA